MGGVVYVNNDGITEFNDCFFEDNSALQGVILYAINTAMKNSMLNCKFKANYYRLFSTLGLTFIERIIGSYEYKENMDLPIFE